MELTDEEYTEFAANQQRDRERFNILKTYGDFDSIDEVARLTEDVGNHHFNKNSETRLDREIRLLGLEDAIDNFWSRCALLQVSEIAEGTEEARLGNRSYMHLIEESSDVLIRTLNLMTNLLRIGKDKGEVPEDYGIGKAIAEKTEKNIERPPFHGGKRF